MSSQELGPGDQADGRTKRDTPLWRRGILQLRIELCRAFGSFREHGSEETRLTTTLPSFRIQNRGGRAPEGYRTSETEEDCRNKKQEFRLDVGRLQPLCVFTKPGALVSTLRRSGGRTVLH